MLVTLELPTELEHELKTQAESEQVSVSKLVEKLLFQILHPELTIDKIEKNYTDEWVAIEETAWDEQGDPIKGLVVAHAPDRNGLSREVRQFRQQNPKAIIYTFYTGELIPEGVMFVL
ncbi:hypothetical protein QUF64_01810 [Anaerolineales bacterium HSG6]|nr:hypothetical protein [Anaerolineales bacterium HSG6]